MSDLRLNSRARIDLGNDAFDKTINLNPTLKFDLCGVVQAGHVISESVVTVV